MRLTQKQLDRWLAKWQATLRLKDWDVKAELVDRLLIEGNDGACNHELKLRQAVIYVASKKGRPDFVKPFDPENTLVHELIHLIFAPFQFRLEGSPECIAQEQAIDVLATALVESDRGQSSS